MEECDLLQSIDRGLDPFGSSTKHAIYWKMYIQGDHPQGELISDPLKFARGIEELFGDSAIRIKRSIVKEIRKTFDLSIEETRSLSGAIDAAKDKVVGVRYHNARPTFLG